MRHAEAGRIVTSPGMEKYAVLQGVRPIGFAFQVTAADHVIPQLIVTRRSIAQMYMVASVAQPI